MNGLKKLLVIVLAVGFIFPIIGFSGCSPSAQSQAAIYNNQGCDLYDEGRYDEAIAEYTKAIELDQNDARYYCNRGIAYNQKGQYDLAIADYNKAIELDQNDARYYYNRGIAYTHKGQYDLAIADFNKAIQFSANADLTQHATKMLANLTQNPPLGGVIPLPPVIDTPPAPIIDNVAPGITAPDTSTGELKSIYDGTYRGTFTYEYRKGQLADRYIWSEPITADLILTLTFKTVCMQFDYVMVEITNVISSDPAFGTGLAGVTPSSTIVLPADPSTTSESMGILIIFPNNAEISTNFGALSVSSDGRTLSNSSVRNENGTWVAYYADYGPLAMPGIYPVVGHRLYERDTGLYYIVDEFKSWSLTKVSP